MAHVLALLVVGENAKYLPGSQPAQLTPGSVWFIYCHSIAGTRGFYLRGIPIAFLVALACSYSLIKVLP